MMQQSAHKKKFAASYSLDKILAIPDDEQVEIDNRTGRTMRKIRRVSRRGSDESGNEEGDDQVRGAYEMQLVTVKGPPEIDASNTQTEQSLISISLGSLRDPDSQPPSGTLRQMQAPFRGFASKLASGAGLSLQSSRSLQNRDVI